MPRRPTALASLARYCLSAAAEAGLSTEPLLAQVGLSAEAVGNLDGRVPVDRLFALWELAALESGDPRYGLHTAERFASPQTIHLVGYAARAAGTLHEAISTVGRFARVMNETTRFELLADQRSSCLRVEPTASHSPWPPVYAEVVLVGYVRMGRFFTGVDLECLAATFQHRAPRDLTEYRRVFGTNLRFGAPHNELSFPSSALELPVRFADPGLKAYLDSLAETMLDRISETTSVQELVRKAVSERLSLSPDLSTIARRLAMSPRTLQRRLREEGAAFNKILDDVRCEISLSMLKDRRFSIAEIAALVGYSDGSAFRSAVRRWTGSSPRALRPDSTPSS